MVGLGRLELPTYGLGNRRSIHLSYSPFNNLQTLVPGDDPSLHHEIISQHRYRSDVPIRHPDSARKLFGESQRRRFCQGQVGRWRTRFTADAGQTVHPDFKASLAGPLRFPLYYLAVDFVAPPTGGPHRRAA